MDSNEFYIERNIEGEEIILGEGQFGIVYKGVCRACPVAIKVLKTDTFSQVKKNEFIREVEIMSSPQMRHPNLVLLLGACVQNVEKWAMITEYMSKGSLEDILHKSNEKISLNRRIQFSIDICTGMAWMSGRDIKIIHRDLKPANILVDANWRCKIGDFGLSLLLARGVITGKRGIQGSALYMAPEALLEKEDLISEKSDVYAFSLLFWEILTRERVFTEFDKRGDLEYFTKSIVELGARPEQQDIHSLLSQILTRCWHNNPDERPSFQQLLSQQDLPSLPFARVLINLPQIHCPHAALLWLNTFGFETRVPLDRFIDTLCIALNLQSSPRFSNCIIQLFQFHMNQKMSLGKFSKLIKWFGPIYGDVGLLNRVLFIMKQRWFYGTKSALEAEAFLDNERSTFGSFLVRLNCGQKVSIEDSPYTISHFSTSGHFLHTRVYPEDGGYYVKLMNGQKIYSPGLIDNLITKLSSSVCVSPCRPSNPFAIHISEDIDGVYQNDEDLYTEMRVETLRSNKNF